MSPEQAGMNSLDIDTRSDVYSLGVLLYKLLTGRPPFDPKSLAQASREEIRRIVREVEPPRPSTHLATLGAARLRHNREIAWRQSGAAVADPSRRSRLDCHEGAGERPRPSLRISDRAGRRHRAASESRGRRRTSAEQDLPFRPGRSPPPARVRRRRARAGFLGELATLNKLFESRPADWELTFQIAGVTSWLGSLAERSGDLAEAVRRFGDQAAQLEALSEADPRAPRWRFTLANSLSLQAGVLAVTGQTAVARQRLARAREFLAPLIAQDEAGTIRAQLEQLGYVPLDPWPDPKPTAVRTQAINLK